MLDVRGSIVTLHVHRGGGLRLEIKLPLCHVTQQQQE